MILRYLMPIVLIYLFWVNLLLAQNEVTIAATKDNTLYESSTGSCSNGGGNHFFAGKTSGNQIRHGLVAFDIAGNIPAGPTIDKRQG